MTTQNDYKTLPDGSIDYAHYATEARAIRSADAHAFLRNAANAIRSFVPAAWILPRQGNSGCERRIGWTMPDSLAAVRSLFAGPKI